MANITEKVQTQEINFTKKVELGDILNRLMNMRNITNADLAKKAGVSRNTIGMLRRNKTDYSYGIRLSTLRAIAEALDVPQRLLFNAPYVVTIKRKIKIKNGGEQ